MSLSSVREIVAIHEITDPWLRIRSCTTTRESGGLDAEGPYSIEAEVKVDPDEPLGAEFGTAAATANTQSHLIGRAREALDALETAGWRLAADWSVKLTARVTRIPGKTPIQDRIEAVISFAVDRDRTDEEMALDPDVVAGEIFDTWARGERPWNG